MSHFIQTRLSILHSLLSKMGHHQEASLIFKIATQQISEDTIRKTILKILKAQLFDKGVDREILTNLTPDNLGKYSQEYQTMLNNFNNSIPNDVEPEEKELIKPKLVKVFGENHQKDVNKVRKLVVAFKPDVILHELYWEDRKFYQQQLPDVKVLPLEPRVLKQDDLASSFLARETAMISNIKKILARGYTRIAIVVGDTHLRTINVPELGPPILTTFLQQINAKILRSTFPEIA